MRVLVTGGSGCIGAAVVRLLVRQGCSRVISLARTAAQRDEAASVAAFGQEYDIDAADICDAEAVKRTIEKHRPDAIIHVAAATHVDESISDPIHFARVNVLGTCNLLVAAKAYWERLPEAERRHFRFYHVSTDEVYGPVASDELVAEGAPYRPSSPYAASKASADLMVRSWHQTYGLPTLISNGCNAFGPMQHPSKFIPKMIINGLCGIDLPVYGSGEHTRNWMSVDDHARGILAVLARGRPGGQYNLESGQERRNIDVVREICQILEEEVPDLPVRPVEALIRFVPNRPGHDLRYGLNQDKMRTDLQWKPQRSFSGALRDTVRWYVDHRQWWQSKLSPQPELLPSPSTRPPPAERRGRP